MNIHTHKHACMCIRIHPYTLTSIKEGKMATEVLPQVLETSKRHRYILMSLFFPFPACSWGTGVLFAL